MQKNRNSQIRRLAKLSLALAFVAQSPQLAMASDDQTILIRHPSVDPIRASAMVEAKGWKTLSQELEARRPGSSKEATLKDALEKAQNAWLSGSIELARERFIKITRMALSADWQSPQRKVIHYAFLRVAQSATNSQERDSYLEQAAALFPDLQPDRDLFPPPIVTAHRSALERAIQSSREIDLKSIFTDYSIILINGRRIDSSKEEKIRLAHGEHRISAFSDSHLSFSESLSADRLADLKVAQPSLATGSCDSPNLNAVGDIESKNLALLYPSDCIRIKSGRGKWLNFEDKTIAAPILQPAYSPQLTLPIDPHPSEVNVSNKKSWIVATGLIVLGATAYAIKRHQESGKTDPTPVHRQGL